MKNLLVGVSGDHEIYFHGSMCNRHGLIAGATGTGKTITLQVLAEQLSMCGTSVFMTDMKGDLSGISKPGMLSEKIKSRLEHFKNLTFSGIQLPVNFIDIEGVLGHPMRVTPSSMGPLLLSRLLELNETQEGVLHIAFQYADQQGLLLLDLKDLKALLGAMLENVDSIKKEYGNITSSSIGAIQRRLLVLETQNADLFFGEPEFQVSDLLVKDFSGHGVVHLLDATTLLSRPRLYGAMLLWLLSEVYETLDEVGDLEIPRLVMFFDEAHILFDDIPRALLERIETVVRLVRSKGVGIFFITQNADDVPDAVLSQLGNRIQHSLRAFTPADTDRIKKIAKTFRSSRDVSVVDEITNLSVGEALVSGLSDKGEPMEVSKVLIRPPFTQIGPIKTEERNSMLERSMFSQKYTVSVDRDSAYEMLKKRAEESKKSDVPEQKKGSTRQGPLEAFLISLARSVGTNVGKQILRGLLGGISKK